jgi:hypothetical protein
MVEMLPPMGLWWTAPTSHALRRDLCGAVNFFPQPPQTHGGENCTAVAAVATPSPHIRQNCACSAELQCDLAAELLFFFVLFAVMHVRGVHELAARQQK